MSGYRERGPRNHTVRQRVVGTAVLVALVVIVVPILIDFRQGDDESIRSTNIPAKPEGYHVEVLSLPGIDDGVRADEEGVGDDTAKAAAESTEEATNESANESGGISSAVVSKAPALGGAGETPDTKAVPSLTDLPAPEAWIVQVGSFGSEPNALALRDKLRGKGYAAFVETVRLGDRRVLRVGVGPQMSKSKSESLRDKLESEMGLSGLVVSYTGDD